MKNKLKKHIKTRIMKMKTKIKNRRKSKKSTKKNKKSHHIIRKKYMKGGGNLNLSVDEKRFNITLRTNEKNIRGDIAKTNFLIVKDTLTGKQYIVNADDNNQFNLFIFESDRYNMSNNKFYLYYINYNDVQSPVNPFKTTEYMQREHIQIINNDSLSLYEKIDNLIEDGLNYYIVLNDYNYGEISNDYVMNIEGALLRLNILNQHLQTKCPNLELRLNYFIEQPGVLTTFYMSNLLTLCLYNQGNCVSSIMCKLVNYPRIEDEDDEDLYIPNSFEIASETNPSMERRKFNKLLRAVIIMIANQIIVYKNPTIQLAPIDNPPLPPTSQTLFVPRMPPPTPLKSPMLNDGNGQPIQNILSQAINPISAWLLINYYNAEIIEEDFIKLIRDEEKKYDRKIKITKRLIDDFIDDNHDIKTKVELTDANVNKAYQEFNLTLNSTHVKDLINCTNVEQSWNSRRVSSSIDMDLE
jgi:hypothetical protein